MIMEPRKSHGYCWKLGPRRVSGTITSEAKALRNEHRGEQGASVSPRVPRTNNQGLCCPWAGEDECPRSRRERTCPSSEAFLFSYALMEWMMLSHTGEA